RSPLARGVWILIGPPAVIGHVFSAGEVIVIKAGVINHHDQNFISYIYVWVIVPIIFRCMNPKTCKYYGGIFNLLTFNYPFGPGHDIFKRPEFKSTLFSLNGNLVIFKTGGDIDHGNILKITVFVPGFQS